ncbi:hypothetical protein BASA81_010596 [Batrachochytrium salamandrivorans]|nr:hypothetical protein BASA81_010596 [Batrachochytrium salamandrivorans]
MMDAESQQFNEQSSSKGCCGYLCEYIRIGLSSNESGSMKFVRATNFINALALFITGLASLLTITNVFSLTFYFLCFYLMVFGLVLCCFELRWKFAEKRVRESFGFLYTFLGRTVFLLFLASFCFGLMGSNQALGLAMGIVTSINALFNMIIMFRHGKMYENPSEGYGSAEDTTAQFMRQNPHLAANAMSAGMNAARDNPAMMRQGVQYAAQNHPQETAQVLAQGAYHGSSVYQT